MADTLDTFQPVTTILDADLMHVKKGTGVNSDKKITGANVKALFATAAQGTTADAAMQDLVDDTTPQLGAALDGQGFDLNNLGVVFLTEQAAAESDVSGKGQLWVKTATPNELYFVDDAGTEFQLGAGAGDLLADGTIPLTANWDVGAFVLTALTFEPDGDTAAGDNAAIGWTATEGLILTGQGSTSDVVIKNDADVTVMSIATGTNDVVFADFIYMAAALDSGMQDNGTVLQMFGTDGIHFRHETDVSVAGASVFAFTPKSGLDVDSSSGIAKFVSILPTINQTSTGGYTALNIDVTETATGSSAALLINAQVASSTKWSVDSGGAMDAGSITSNFGAINTGASAITTTGVITGGTVEATTDTAAADNAAMGYTAAEGLILTGQGSTNDLTIKNDADADVITIPTGGTGVVFAGTTNLSAGTVTGPSGTWDTGGVDIAASDSYAVAGTDILSDSSGTLTLSNVDALDATTQATFSGKQTLFIPAAAMRPTKSNGCAAITDVETTAGRPDMTVLDFDATADEHAQFQIAMPKAWNLGTVTFQVFWTSTAADTDGVSWALQGVSVTDNTTIDVAYGTPIVVDDANQSAAEEQLVSVESAAVTIAGTPADDDMCYFRIFRDVSDSNDTATEDARLIGIKLFFTTDAVNDA